MGAANWWSQRRFGLLVHANLATVPAWAPIGQNAGWYRAHTDPTVSDVFLQTSPLVETLAHHRDRWAHIEHHDDFFPFLTFDEWDADEWTGLARDAGMGYAVMVAKHHDGLCWWDAPNTDRTVLHDGPARNVLGQFAAACERADVVFGTSYSLLDWADERYPGCEYVDDVVHPQVLDLVKRYGTKMLWGDGHWGRGASHWRSDELAAAARNIDPEIVVNDRWWLESPDVRSFDVRLPDAIVAEPWEHRRALGASYGHNRAEHGENLLTATAIVSLLTEVVAKGGHLLIGLGPDSSGRIPEPHAERLRAAGGWIRRHQRLVDHGTPWSTWGDDDCRYLLLDDELHAIDVGGRGRFAALADAPGGVLAIETLDGEPVAYEATGGAIELQRPSRRAQRLPVAYRVRLGTAPAPPIALFAEQEPAASIELATAIGDAKPGSIVQLGEGTYLGPARIPDGVTVRGLGPERTLIDGLESAAVALGDGARLEHCSVAGGGDRIVWLPKIVLHLAGAEATVLGCRIDGHCEVRAHDTRIVSCSLVGVVAEGADRVTVNRSTCRGMQWDVAIDITGGVGHLVESCEFSELLTAIRLTDTVGAVVRGNRVETRWWGIHLIDTENSHVVANAFEHTMRAVDVDGGTLAIVSGNAAIAGDSGCVLQRGASDCEISGNYWERCRIGLLAWDAGDLRHRDNSCVDLGEPGAEITVGP